MKKLLVLILLSGIALSFTPRRGTRLSVPTGWPAPVYDFSKNTLNPDKILLGRVLFYDPILSADSTISCVSCHLSYSAFTHIDHALSHGINGRIGTRNSPALMNLAWGKLFMWDGAINHLDVQPLAPIAHPDEMSYRVDSVVVRLNRSALYRKLFVNAWGDSVATGERMLKSMAQFMTTLISAQSKYDSVMRGAPRVAFTTQEANGYRLFRQHCASCHTEPLFTNNEFANNGLAADTTLNDMGRMKVTGNASDSLKFKIPTLRNCELTYPYMHDGRFKTLREVVQHYTSGIQHTASLAPQLQQTVPLTANDRVDLVAFLLTLTDKKFIFNPDFGFPREILMP
jgi:cytochrome c peroxidase